MIRHVLAATDFSTRSDRALRRAILLAKHLGAGLSLVHVVDDDQPPYLVEAHIDTAESMLAGSARTIEKFDDIACDAKVVTGDAFAGIIRAADEAATDLIVLGAHRRQLLDIFVGTTAARTIARSRRPVLMAAGVPSAPYARALVALDIEEPSRAMLKRVHEMGVLRTSEVVAMHAFDVPARAMLQRAMSAKETIDQYVLDEGLQASKDLGRFLAGTGSPTTRHRSLAINGSTARTILECASDDDADLIVVGTSQRKGMERLLLGSVAEDVLGDADRDVLVVPK